MPEMQRVFAKGRMNKDLDERMVPNGEYRDALNLDLSVSEGSDVGAFENIKGNKEIVHKAYNSSTLLFTNWNSDYISNLNRYTDVCTLVYVYVCVCNYNKYYNNNNNNKKCNIY